jgi:hypothetical protein
MMLRFSEAIDHLPKAQPIKDPDEFHRPNRSTLTVCAMFPE